MIRYEECTQIGILSKKFKFSGELIFSSNSSSISLDSLLKETNFLLIERHPSHLVPYRMISVRPHNRGYIIQLDDVCTDQDADKLTQCSVYIENSIYKKNQKKREKNKTAGAKELVGYEVYNSHNVCIGEICDYYSRKMQDMVEIQLRDEDRTILLPLHSDLVIKEEKRKKRLTVDLPRGLIEL